MEQWPHNAATPLSFTTTPMLRPVPDPGWHAYNHSHSVIHLPCEPCGSEPTSVGSWDGACSCRLPSSPPPSRDAADSEAAKRVLSSPSVARRDVLAWVCSSVLPADDSASLLRACSCQWTV